MKSRSKIENILKEIQKDSIKEKNENKKKWYKIRKYLLQGNKLTMHNERKLQQEEPINFTQNSKEIEKDPLLESSPK